MTFFLKIFFLNFLFLNHPIHVSVTNIDYLNEKKEFYIAVKFFTDDFENIIKQKYDVDLNLGKENQVSNYEYYFIAYFVDNFSLSIDGIDKTVKKIQFEKFVSNDLSVWIYFSYKNNDKFNKIEIKNSFMTDIFHDQTNLTIFTFNDFQKAIKFDNDNILESFEIQ